MSEIRKVRRFWRKDLNTELKEHTAITKLFDEAISDISSALHMTRARAGLELISKGSMESKYQLWVLLPSLENPFAQESKKTPF